jgi:hypothetical protein
MPSPARKPDAPEYAPRPRWVKILGGIALLVLLATIVVLIVRGPHGPGMHGGLRDIGPSTDSVSSLW